MGWKKVLKQIVYIVAIPLLKAGLKLLFSAVDKNEDGAITKEEAYNYVVDKIDALYAKK